MRVPTPGWARGRLEHRKGSSLVIARGDVPQLAPNDDRDLPGGAGVDGRRGSRGRGFEIGGSPRDSHGPACNGLCNETLHIAEDSRSPEGLNAAIEVYCGP